MHKTASVRLLRNSHKRVHNKTLSRHYLPTGAACLAADQQVAQLCQDMLCPVLNFPFFSLAFGICAIIRKRECGIAVSAPSLHHHGCCFHGALCFKVFQAASAYRRSCAYSFLIPFSTCPITGHKVVYIFWGCMYIGVSGNVC